MVDTELRYDLIAPTFVEGMANVLGFEPSEKHIKSVIMEHWYSYLQGDILDPITGQKRLYHMGVELMRLDNMVNKDEITAFEQNEKDNPVGQFDAIMNLSFPKELHEVETEFASGLRLNPNYNGWILYGFKEDARAVVLNTNANEVIVAVSFAEFEDFFSKRQPQ